jgi:hypothetical protein
VINNTYKINYNYSAYKESEINFKALIRLVARFWSGQGIFCCVEI